MRPSLVPILLILLVAPGAALAASPDHAAILRWAVEERLLPGYAAFAAETAALAESARAHCAGDGEAAAVEAAYQRAFDAWIQVAPIDFGPVRSEGVYETVEYWPDPSGATASAVTFLLAAEDPVVNDPKAFARIAPQARGLMALDWLLYDRYAPKIEPGGYPCRLVAAVTEDLERIGAAIRRDWRDRFAPAFMEAGEPGNPLYFRAQDAARELYQAVARAVEATRELRVLRPLAAPERPAPQAAEAWRSDRPLRNIRLMLASLSGLTETVFLPELEPERAARLQAAFDAAEAAAEEVEAPLAAAVADPEGRKALEALAEALRTLRTALDEEIGEPLGLEPPAPR